MLIKKKKIRSHREDRYLALVLATTAGILNAMALGAFGFFPSHMSGNASQFSREVTLLDLSDLTLLAALLAAFVLGCTLSRMLVIVGEKRHVRTIFCLVLLAEGVVLTLAALYESLFFSPGNNREFLTLLALLMGIHNSTSTQLSNGRVRSTHITGTLTDAGIAFGSVLSSLFSRSLAAERRFYLKQLFTHLITVFSFLGGCSAGLLLFKGFGFPSMIVLGVFLMLVAFSAVALTLHTAARRAH